MTCADDPHKDALFEEAAAWLVRLREPDVSETDRRAFARWRDAAPGHSQAFAEAQALWDNLAAPAAAALVRCPQAKRSFPGARSPIPSWAAMAASLVALVAAAVWTARGGLENLQADYVTAVGETRIVDLADGSRATLNTDTALAVDMTGGERRLRLLRGEAFFEAARNPARPFVVTATAGQVRVLGTRFNLRTEAGGAVAAVEEGVVAVIPAASPGAALTLNAGQAARMEPASARRLDGLEPADETAWRRGRLVFYRAPLGEVAAALNRYHHGYIIIVNDNLRAKPVTGVFDATRPATAVDLIEAALGARSYRLGDRLILLR